MLYAGQVHPRIYLVNVAWPVNVCDDVIFPPTARAFSTWVNWPLAELPVMVSESDRDCVESSRPAPAHTVKLM